MNRTIEKHLDNCRKSIQDEFICYLDGMPDRIISHLCQIVADHLETLKNQLIGGEKNVR